MQSYLLTQYSLFLRSTTLKIVTRHTRIVDFKLICNNINFFYSESINLGYYWQKHCIFISPWRDIKFAFFVCLFVRLRISQRRMVRSAWNFGSGQSKHHERERGSLGVGGLRRAEKEANEIFVTMGVNGEFLHFGGFWAISQQRVHGSTPNIICVGTMPADVPPLWGPSAPGGGGGGVKNSKN